MSKKIIKNKPLKNAGRSLDREKSTTEDLDQELESFPRLLQEIDRSNRQKARELSWDISTAGAPSIRTGYNKNRHDLLNNFEKDTASYIWTYSHFIPKTLLALDTNQTLSQKAVRVFISAAINNSDHEDSVGQILSKLSIEDISEAELLSGARSLRASMFSVPNHRDAIDIVGTGGDGHNTYNISTATAFVVAALGVKVAKHGNRSASSKSGAADVLEALGVNVFSSRKTSPKALREIRLAFLFAQSYHPILKNVASVRKKLGKRTIFNLLGPLANPARPRQTLLGVYDEHLLVPMAKTLSSLGADKAWVVNGADGMDEITITGPTKIAKLDNGEITIDEILPEDVGLKSAPLAELKGGNAEENARAMRGLFAGEKTAFRDAVLLNAAAALTIAGKTNDLKTGIDAAAEAIGMGKAQILLHDLAKLTKS